MPNIMPCGHDISEVIHAGEGANYCGACEREARLQAGMRLACFDCGASWARIIRLSDDRIIRACEDCLRTTASSWAVGQYADARGIITRSGLVVPYSMIAPHRKQVRENHQQSLEELALGGGWSDWEILLILDDKSIKEIINTPFGEMDGEGENASVELRRRIAAGNTGRGGK